MRRQVRHPEVDGGRAAPRALTATERAELTQLRWRVKTLETERDLLRETTAFFAMQAERSSELWRRRKGPRD
jgi:transposase